MLCVQQMDHCLHPLQLLGQISSNFDHTLEINRRRKDTIIHPHQEKNDCVMPKDV